MKKIFSLVLLALALAFAPQVKSAAVVTAAATNSVNSIITAPAYLVSVAVANATGVTATIKLFDASSTVITNVRGSFTIPLSYATNIVTSFTNINGVPTLITNSALFTTTQTIAQTTNNYPTVNTIVVPANSTVTWTPVNGYYTSYGLTSTNDAVVSITTAFEAIR